MPFEIGYKKEVVEKVLKDFEDNIKQRYLSSSENAREDDGILTVYLPKIIKAILERVLAKVEEYNGKRSRDFRWGEDDSIDWRLGRCADENAVHSPYAKSPQKERNEYDAALKGLIRQRDCITFFRNGDAQLIISGISLESEGEIGTELARVLHPSDSLKASGPIDPELDFELTISLIPNIKDYYTLTQLLKNFPGHAQTILDLISPFKLTVQENGDAQELTASEKETLVRQTLDKQFSNRSEIEKYYIGHVLAKAIEAGNFLEVDFLRLYPDFEAARAYLPQIRGYKSLLLFLRRYPQEASSMLDSIPTIELGRYYGQIPDDRYGRWYFLRYLDSDKKALIQKTLEDEFSEQSDLEKYHIGLVLAKATAAENFLEGEFARLYPTFEEAKVYFPQIQSYYGLVLFLKRYPQEALSLLALENFPNFELHTNSENPPTEKVNHIQQTLMTEFPQQNDLEKYHIGLVLAKTVKVFEEYKDANPELRDREKLIAAGKQAYSSYVQIRQDLSGGRGKMKKDAKLEAARLAGEIVPQMVMDPTKIRDYLENGMDGEEGEKKERVENTLRVLNNGSLGEEFHRKFGQKIVEHCQQYRSQMFPPVIRIPGEEYTTNRKSNVGPTRIFRPCLIL